MRKLLSDRSAIGLFFFIIIVAAVWLAFDFNAAARMMPLIIGVPTLILATVVLAMELASQRSGKPPKVEGGMDGSRLGKNLTAEQARGVARSERSVILWLIALVIMIWLLGLLWSIPVFLILYQWLQGREPWRLTLSISLGTWAVVYLLFVQILKMELYGGLIQDLLGG